MSVRLFGLRRTKRLVPTGMCIHDKRRFTNSIIERMLAQKFQKLLLFQQVCTARYLWNIPYVSVSSLEQSLHHYYYELSKLLCDSSTSFTSLRDNFNDEIFEFMMERGSHPGIPLFHSYRNHNLSSFDDGFISPQSIRIELANLSMSINCRNHITKHAQKDIDTNTDSAADVEHLKARLSKIYKNESALQEALQQLNVNTDKPKQERTESDIKDRAIEFDLEIIKNEPIPVYLEAAMNIYHGEDGHKGFEPNLVSDFINVNAADWNRSFHWKVNTQTPIGYIECKDGTDDDELLKLKQHLDQLLTQGNQVRNMEWVNVLYSYKVSKCFRLQSTNNISLWKVLDATETIM
eukprot:39698_1